MAVTGTYHHVHLITRDPDATADWWAKAMGAEIQSRAEHRGAVNIQMNLAETILSVRGVRPGETIDDPGGSRLMGIHHFGLWVDDIEGAIQQVVDNGGTLVDPVQTGITGNFIAFVQCPDDVLVEFLQPKK